MNPYAQFAMRALNALSAFGYEVRRILTYFSRLLQFVFASLLLGTLLMGMTAYILFFEVPLPDVRELRTYKPNTVSVVYDRSGEKITEWYFERRLLMAYEEIPERLIQAILSAEDKNFFSHGGIDWTGITRAAIKNVEHAMHGTGGLQGGSTITQQLMRLMFLNPNDRSIERKMHEAFLSYKVEWHFTKKEILIMYINKVYLGEGQHGFAAAADRYFGKELKELTIPELALLAGIIAAPNAFSPVDHPEASKVRRNEILRRMFVNGYIPESELKTYQESPLQIIQRSDSQLAPHAIERIKKILIEGGIPARKPWEGNLTIRTTLDADLQRAAEKSVAEGIAEYEARNPPKAYKPLEACLLVIEHHTAQVVAYVGGRDFKSNKNDHCFQARRQPGSLFKTFVLTAGFEKDDSLTLDLTVNDALRCYGTFRDPKTGTKKEYCPKNYALEKPLYAGIIPIKKAFADSRNAAFVSFGRFQVGLDRIVDLAAKLDFIIPEKNISLILGTSEVSPWKMTRAFTVFPNDGKLLEPYLIEEVIKGGEETPVITHEPESRDILTEHTAGLMRDALRYVVTNGTGRRAKDLPVEISGKTGTTSRKDPENEARAQTIDAWFCGFSPDYTACVWTGFDQPDNIGTAEAGAKTALPIFIKFMQQAYANEPKETPKVPKASPKPPTEDGALGITELDELLLTH